MVPVGEGRAKIVTPLTDIQLLLPVRATMLGKGEGEGEGGGRSEEEAKNGGWGMKQEIGRREKIMSMTTGETRRRERGRREGVEREGSRMRERG